TAQNVLFNITRTGGTGLGMSGGLATESVLYGIVLADSSQIQESPGLVVGEMICGDNMSISSGAQVQGIKVPDGGETAALLGAALLGIAGLRRKLRQG
ncbi:MAG: VPDSG-CTERM sorting domain-containing protein, partial [Verrucomicrobia bacterium]|nr:VPDSG-CTERM sorting domain-containing protein [Verrucomicrobiota bacterium]